MKILTNLGVGLLCLLVGAAQVSAHSIVIGYTPGVNPGEVNLWVGSYHGHNQGDGPNFEGSAHLTGVTNPLYDTTTAFVYAEGNTTSNAFGNTDSAPPPAGLVFGTNLFSSANFAGFYTGGVLADVPDWVKSWQAVTISGLTAGTYDFEYIPAPNPSAHWADWGDLATIQLVLTAGDTGGGGTNPDGSGGSVPDSGMTLTLLGVALAALGGLRRKLST